MKIQFRFLFSHENSEKYQYFIKKKNVCIFRRFRAKIALKRRAIRDVINIGSEMNFHFIRYL